MSFSVDPIKQAQEAVFSHKIKKVSHPPLNFNNDSVSKYIKNIWAFIWTITWTFVKILKGKQNNQLVM